MAYIYDLADVWASAGTTFTAIKMNVTDTASNAASLLMDLQVGGVSRFGVRKDGLLYFGSASSGIFKQSGSNYIESVTGFSMGAGTTSGASMDANGLSAGPAGQIGFTTGNSIGTRDTILARDAANTLAQRNGVNAQAFNLYNTYTDASNYERGFMKWSTNELQIGSEAAGTGTNRIIRFLAPNEVLRLTSTTADFKAPVYLSAVNGSGSLFFQEQTTVPSAQANIAKVYAEDDGAGKTRLMVRFGSGASVQIAIEP